MPGSYETEKEMVLQGPSPKIGEIGDHIFCLIHPDRELVHSLISADEINGIISVQCPECGEKFQYSRRRNNG